MINFPQVRIALITLAKPEKNNLPSSKLEIATNSSKEAPAQKAFVPSDFNIIINTASLFPKEIISLESRSSSSLGKQLLDGCPKTTVAILFWISVYRLPFILVVLIEMNLE